MRMKNGISLDTVALTREIERERGCSKIFSTFNMNRCSSLFQPARNYVISPDSDAVMCERWVDEKQRIAEKRRVVTRT